MKAVKPREIEEPPIHDVEGTRFGRESIEDRDVTEPPVADVNEGRDIAAQIEECVQSNGAFGLLKRRPRKHRQTKVDRRGVQRVDSVLEINAERLIEIQRPSDRDETLRKVGVDAPIANSIRIGQRIAGNRRSNA